MKKKRSFKKAVLYIVILAAAITVYLFISSLSGNQSNTVYPINKEAMSINTVYPDARFAVISDLHFYSTSLGIEGQAFQDSLLSDRKLLIESEKIIDKAIDILLETDIEFILIPGDLTKDGELINHEGTAKALSRLTDNGIKVFIVPGNHDVNNPDAHRYDGNEHMPVDSVSSQQFAEIYNDFGYGDALSRDTDSLSYVAEINEDMWIIALDSTRSRENVPGKGEIVGGKLVQSQVLWLESMLKEAYQNNKAVIVMQHHGIVEHWDGQRKLHPDYLVEDYEEIGHLLASYGVRLAFTGHYHAQDITLADFNDDGFIYDIETGSLITPPCAYRYCSIEDNKITVDSDFLVAKYALDTDFAKKSNKFVADSLKREAFDVLKGYLVNDKDATRISEYASEAFLAHYSGDENEENRPPFNPRELSLWGRLIYSQQKYVIEGLWSDLPPADNSAGFNLK